MCVCVCVCVVCVWGGVVVYPLYCSHRGHVTEGQLHREIFRKPSYGLDSNLDLGILWCNVLTAALSVYRIDELQDNDIYSTTISYALQVQMNCSTKETDLLTEIYVLVEYVLILPRHPKLSNKD